jgi:hypothetical protein
VSAPTSMCAGDRENSLHQPIAFGTMRERSRVICTLTNMGQAYRGPVPAPVLWRSIAMPTIESRCSTLSALALVPGPASSPGSHAKTAAVSLDGYRGAV